MFQFGDQSVDVSLSDGVMIVATPEHQILVSIEIRHMLKMTPKDGNLTVYYVEKKKKKTLSVKTISLDADFDDIQNLYRDLDAKFRGRPKSLLVIINPNAGKKKGIKVYEKIADSLFQLCGVKADVIVTRRQNEPTEILKNYDLSKVDGIVTVGGDGLYCECMNGLVKRTQQDNNINLNNHNADIVSSSLPIGIIPAGSGDVIVQYLHGTRCARTAVLHILLGHHVDSNIVSVHEGRHLLSYSALVLGFGLFGDMMHDCEKFRWMGPSRYNIIPLGSMLKRREFDVEVEYYPLTQNEKPKTARLYGRQISLPNGFLSQPKFQRKQRTKSSSDLMKETSVNEDLVKEAGRIYAVDSHAIMMKEKSGRMTPHFGQNSLMVYTTHKCTWSDHVSQLTKVKNEKPDCYDYKFVRKHEVSGYRVKLQNVTVKTTGNKKELQKDYYINCDGECIRLKETVFNVKLHRNAVKFFGDFAD
ncbi:ceramide kinase-like [Mytilus californianus]|uniref:ceramide kinase-like n=1 Tax=Mytilus californianus TaxID=6549 RepID=UPI0022455270|nr:ceramide kinase-like [Mytilus californianus]